MTTSRTLMRTVVPPVIAAAAVMLLVHPLGALAAPAPATPLPTTGVAFSSDSQLADGVVHSRIAMATDASAGQATVSGTSCAVQLAPGQVTDLTCPTSSSPVTIHVTLSDGQRVALTLS